MYYYGKYHCPCSLTIEAPTREVLCLRIKEHSKYCRPPLVKKVLTSDLPELPSCRVANLFKDIAR